MIYKEKLYSLPDQSPPTFLEMMFQAFLLAAAALHLSNAALPKGWKSCKLSDPNSDVCLQNEITKAVKSLKSGDRKLGALPVDPLFIEKLVINQGSGPVSLKMTLRNLTFEGISDMKYIDLKNNNFKNIKSKIFLKKLVNKGLYQADGKVLALPLKGEGPCTIVWDGVTTDIDHSFKVVDKNGKKYLQSDRFVVSFTPKKATLRFDNLFNGNKQLSDTTNAFLNENWQDIVKEVKPALEQTIATVFRQIADNVLINIPMDEIVLK